MQTFLTWGLKGVLECTTRRLFLLDMLLGNPDRLPCEALGWRGNPHNILYCCGGAHAGRMVAIDSAVQRRPPGAHGSHTLADFPYRAYNEVLVHCREGWAY